MNISLLSVGPPYRGGISEQTYYLYKNLSINNEVELINFNRQYPKFLFPGKNQYDDESKFQIKSNHRVVDSINPLSWSKTSRYITHKNPNLILLRFWNPFFAISHGSIIKKIKKRHPEIKIIAICDNIIPHEKSMFDLKLIHYLFKNVDGFIVMSSKVEQELLNIKSNSNYKKIFHPVSEKIQRFSKSEARDKLKINRKNIILFYGFIRDYKGLETLIKSNRFLTKNLSDYQIIICGECYGNDAKYLNLIKENSFVKNDIIWMNKYLSDEASSLYFSASDVVVLPYNTASQSGVIPLSYSYERPVIASNILGINEMIENGKTGFLFEKKNDEDLSNKITQFFKSDVNYKTNIHEFREQFSWEYFTAEIMNLYKEL